MYMYIATPLDRNFSFSMVVVRSQTKQAIFKAKRDQPKTCRWVSSMVELIKDASNSISTKNPIRRIFSNPVTYAHF